MRPHAASTLVIASFALAACSSAVAQVALTTAVDMALTNSPRVRMARAEVDRARAGVAESTAVFIPAVVAGGGIGKTFGFPLGQPSIFNVQAQSLVFNFSQFDYIRSAKYARTAAELSLEDAREAIAADTALTWVALARDEARDTALNEQAGFAQHLVEIAQARFDAGRDNAIELTTAKLTGAQLRLARLRAASETAADREHLARLTGMPAAGLRVGDAAFPPMEPESGASAPAAAVLLSPAIASAYANARSKRQQAFGDARYLYRPQFAFGLQYDRFATKLNNYDTYYPPGSLKPNNAQIGVQITVPLFDRSRRARAKASAAAASSALFEADYARDQALDGQQRLLTSIDVLRARVDVTGLEQQLAAQQLDATVVQLAGTAGGNAPPVTPKEEQTARIGEREKYLAVLDATYSLRQAEINLLRQTGGLERWLYLAARAPAKMVPSPTP